MQALAFYPAIGKTRTSRIDGYPVNVTEEAPVALGQFPLLVLSHGNTGSPLALHYGDVAGARGLYRGGGGTPRGQRPRPQSPWAP